VAGRIPDNSLAHIVTQLVIFKDSVTHDQLKSDLIGHLRNIKGVEE
jgi:hypothetical protein